MKAVNWVLMAWLVIAAPVVAADAGEPDTASFEQAVRRAMQEFQVPGMAVGVIREGRIVYAAGHGVREIGKPESVDTETLFRIASATKAFTSAALAVLVDDGAVAWDGAVSDYLPELRMNDPWVTAELSLTDLLAHRSGLTPHAGDLLLWPVPNDFTTGDIIHALRYFPLEAGFRKGYTYDNVLYLVAGEVVSRVSGQGWGEFVDRRIMAPLGMQRCFAGVIPRAEMHNLAAPHARVDGQTVVVERNRIPAEPSVFAPAGGIACSLGDMLTWLQAQLGHGTLRGNVELFSADQGRHQWAPHNWLGVGASDADLHRTHFSAYGLGWRLRDIQGLLEVSHTGALDGMCAHALMIPELDLGIVVLTNASSSAARDAVMYSIEYAYLPEGQRDWIEYYKTLESEAQDASRPEPAVEQAPRFETPARPLETYTGRFRDPWFGDVLVSEDSLGLRFAAVKSPNLSGPMEHLSGDVFIARWTDRSMEMDAYVRFRFDESGRLDEMRMKRVFEDGEDGPDHFQYLRFSPVRE